jgi:iron complex outermembrane recepter protein
MEMPSVGRAPGAPGTLPRLLFAGILLCLAPLASAEEASPQEKRSDAGAQQAETKPHLPIVVEKVTVSATVAAEGRDPASVTSLPREEIAVRNRGQDMAMLLAETPNAYAYSDAGNGVGYAYLSLRGFDQRRVAVYVNGVPLNDPESQQVYFIDLADLAGSLSSLQVQRGTGTALYGSPAVGGVVNLETGALSSTRGGELTLGAGSFGTYRGAWSQVFPLDAGRSALSLRLAGVRSDGYRDPSWTRHGTLALGYQRIREDSVLRVNLLGGPEKTQLAYYGVPIAYLRGEVSGDADADRRANPLQPGEIDRFFQPQLQILHDWRLRPGLLVKNNFYSILGDGYFRQWSDSYSYDPLGPEPPTPALPEESLASVWRKREVSKRQFGWLPSLTLEHARGRLTLGGELRTGSTHHQGTITDAASCSAPEEDGSCGAVGPPLSSSLPLYDYTQRKTTASLYAREAVQLRPELSLNLELQATHHRFAMGDDLLRGYSWSTTYAFVTPRLGLNWSPAERLRFYASFSTARSEPRFDDIWNPQDPWADPAASFARVDGRHYEDAYAGPERLRAFEVGGSWRSTRLRLRANAYFMDFRDELVYAGGINEDGLPITDNAARSLHRGLEAEGALQLPVGLELSGSLAISDDVLKDYVLRYGPSPADAVDYSGNRIALFPTHQARLRLARGFGATRASFGLRRVGTIYLDNSENERKDPQARLAPGYVDKQIEPFTLADLRLELDLKRMLGRGARGLSLLVSVDNLFDRRYAASGYAYGEPYFFPGATRALYTGLTLSF